MKKHIRASHDIRLPKKVVDYYHSATVQTLFHVTNRAHFQVLPQLENIPIENPFHQVLQEYTPALSILPPPIAGPDTERERTPFMRIMDWDHHLSHFLTDKESLDRILSLQQAPTPGEVYEKAHFSMLTTAVLEYIQEGIRICRQESQGFTVQQKLMHGKVLPSKPSYWNPLSENGSPAKYAAIISDFFKVTLRCHAGHPSGYVIPLTEAQSIHANRLRESLLNGHEIGKVVRVLHDFSFSLLVEQPLPGPETDSPEGWTCPVRCYLAVQAVKGDGSFITPDNLTQKLAKLKYFCNNCALIQAEGTKGTVPDGMIK